MCAHNKNQHLAGWGEKTFRLVFGLEITFLNKLTELFTVLILVQFGFSNLITTPLTI